MTRPAITVLMPVHNGIDYVESALRSVMEQSFRDIEILVIDDCSSDGTAALLDQLAAEDPRIRVEHLSQNLRLPGALNHGLALARAPLVARMDADDLCHPRRLEIQKAFMDAHPEIDMVGASIEKIRPDGTRMHFEERGHDAFACRWLTRFTMPLVHPTFMLRLPGPDGMDLRYDAQWSVSEDYDFCGRLARAGKVASLPEMLLQYRVHDGSISKTKRDLQKRQSYDLAQSFQRQDLPDAVVTALAPVLDLHFGDAPPTWRIVTRAFRGLSRMIAHDAQTHPDRRDWMRRRAARLMWFYLTEKGLGRRRRALLFAAAGPLFLHPLIQQIRETRGTLPVAQRRAPPVWTQACSPMESRS